MPWAECALAAGFGKHPRFNETFHDLFPRPPERACGAGGRPARGFPRSHPGLPLGCCALKKKKKKKKKNAAALLLPAMAFVQKSQGPHQSPAIECVVG